MTSNNNNNPIADALVYAAKFDGQAFTDARKYDLIIRTASQGRSILLGAKLGAASAVAVENAAVRVHAPRTDVFGKLVLNGGMEMVGGFDVVNDLTVRGATTTDGPLRVGVDSNLSVSDKGASVRTNLHVGNDAIIAGNAVVSGDLQLRGRLTSPSSSTTSAKSAVSLDALDVSGHAFVGGELRALSGTLIVDPVKTRVANALEAGAGITAQGDALFRGGALKLLNASSNVVFAADDAAGVKVNRSAEFSRDALFSRNAKVEGAASVADTLHVSSKAFSVASDPSVTSLTVDGAANVRGGLDVSPDPLSDYPTPAFQVSDADIAVKRRLLAFSNAELREGVDVSGASGLRVFPSYSSSRPALFQTNGTGGAVFRTDVTVASNNNAYFGNDVTVGAAAAGSGRLRVGVDALEASDVSGLSVRRDADFACNLIVRSNLSVGGAADVLGRTVFREGIGVTGDVAVEHGAFSVSPEGAHAGGSNVLAFRVRDSGVDVRRDLALAASDLAVFADSNTVANTGPGSAPYPVFRIRSSDGSVYASGQVDVRGALTSPAFTSTGPGGALFTRDAIANSNLTVRGNTTLDGTLTVNAGIGAGASNVANVRSDHVSLHRHLRVLDDAGMTVAGATSLVGSLRVGNPADVDVLRADSASVTVSKPLRVVADARVEGRFAVDVAGTRALTVDQHLATCDRDAAFSCNVDVRGDVVFRGPSVSYLPVLGQPPVLSASDAAVHVYRDVDVHDDLRVRGDARVQGAFRVNPGAADLFSVRDHKVAVTDAEFAVSASGGKGLRVLRDGDTYADGAFTVRPDGKGSAGTAPLRVETDRVGINRHLSVTGGSHSITGRLDVFPDLGAQTARLPALSVPSATSSALAKIAMNRDVAVASNVSVAGDLDVRGSSVFAGALGVTDDVNMRRNLHVRGDVIVDGQTQVRTGLRVLRGAADGPTLAAFETAAPSSSSSGQRHDAIHLSADVIRITSAGYGSSNSNSNIWSPRGGVVFDGRGTAGVDVARGKFRVVAREGDADTEAVLVAQDAGVFVHRDVTVRGADMDVADGELRVAPARGGASRQALAVTDAAISCGRDVRVVHGCNLNVTDGGGLTVSGDAEVAGSAVFEGALSARGDVALGGTTTLNGPVEATAGAFDVKKGTSDLFHVAVDGARIVPHASFGSGVTVTRGDAVVRDGGLSVAPGGAAGSGTRVLNVGPSGTDMAQGLRVVYGAPTTLSGSLTVGGTDASNAVADISASRVGFHRDAFSACNLRVGGRLAVAGDKTELNEQVTLSVPSPLGAAGQKDVVFDADAARVLFQRPVQASCNLAVEGNVSVAGGVTSDAFSLRTLKASGNAYVAGELAVGAGPHSNLRVTASNVRVGPDSRFDHDVDIDGYLRVLGGAAVHASFAVLPPPAGSNTSSSASSPAQPPLLYVTDGATTIETDVTLGSNLDVASNVTLANDLVVGRHVDVAGDMDVSGDLTTEGGATVHGDASFQGATMNFRANGGVAVLNATDTAVTVSRPLEVVGDVDVTGGLTVREGGSDSLTVGQSTVSVNRDLDVKGGELHVTEDAHFGNDVYVAGTLYADTGLNVRGPITASTLNAGSVSSSGNQTVNGVFTVRPGGSNAAMVVGSNAVRLLENLAVQGDAQVDGAFAVKNAAGNTLFRVTDSGGIVANRDTTLNGALTVAQNTRLGSNVSIAGALTMSGGVPIDASSSTVSAETLNIGSGGFQSSGDGIVLGTFAVKPGGTLASPSMLYVSSSGVNVAGDATVGGHATLQNGLTVTDAAGSPAFAVSSSQVDVSGRSFTVTGGATSLQGGDFTVTVDPASASSNPTMAVSDALISLNRNTDVAGKLEVGGDVAIDNGGGLTVQGPSTFSSALHLGDDLFVTCNLTVGAGTTLNDGLTVSTTASGATTSSTALQVTSSNVRVTARPFIADSNISVAGTAAFASNVSVRDGLVVRETATFGATTASASGAAAVSVPTGQIRGAPGLGFAFPSYSWVNDTDTGMFHAAPNQIGFTNGGAESVRIDARGDVGIGTSNPTSKLDVVGGNVSSTGRALFAAGTSVDPAFSFGSASNTGMFLTSNSNIGFSIAGSPAFTITNAGVSFQHPIQNTGQILGYTSGGATAPAFSFTGDTNTGFYRVASNVVGISTGGTERLRLDDRGRLGVGLPSSAPAPAVELDVGGSAQFAGRVFLSPDYSNAGAPALTWTNDTDTGVYRTLPNTVAIGTGGVERLTVTPGNGVGVGVTTPTAALDVAGGIRASDQVTAFAGSLNKAAFGFDGASNTGMYLDASSRSSNTNNLGLAVDGSNIVYITPSDGVGVYTSAPNAALHVSSGDATNVTSTGTGAGGGGVNLGGYRVHSVSTQLSTTAGDFVNLMEILAPGQRAVLQIDVCDATLTSTYFYAARLFQNFDGDDLLLPFARACQGGLSDAHIDRYQLRAGSTGSTAPSLVFRIVRTNAGASSEGPIRCTFRVAGYPDDATPLLNAGPFPSASSNTGVIADTDRARYAASTQITQLSSSNRDAFVGIGVARPQRKLHVAGSVLFEDEVSADRFVGASNDATAPTFSFRGDASTGMYLQSSNTVGLSTAGAERVVVDGAGNVGVGLPASTKPDARLQVDGNLRVSNGVALLESGATSAAPALAFTGDQNTGLFRPASNVFAFTTAGSERARFTANGSFGVNESNDATINAAQVYVNGDVHATDQILAVDGTASRVGLGFLNHGDTGFHFAQSALGGSNQVSTAVSGVDRFTVTPTGTGVLTTTPNAALHVNGNANLDGYRVGTVDVTLPNDVVGKYVDLFEILTAGNGCAVHLDVCDDNWSATLVSSYVFTPSGTFSSGQPYRLVMPYSRSTAGDAGDTTRTDPYQLQVGSDGTNTLNFRLVRTTTANPFTGPIRCTFRIAGIEATRPGNLSVGPTSGGTRTVPVLSARSDEAHATQITQIAGANRRGYVGIGVARPQYKLDVDGPAHFAGDTYADRVLLQRFGTASAPALAFAQDSNTGLFHPSTPSSSNSDLALATAGTEKLRVLQDGNVGIGTAAPSFLLEVAGKTRADYFVASTVEEGATARNPALTWSGNTDSGFLYHSACNLLGISMGGAERVTVTSNGDVGINHTWPDARLHIGGDVKATDQVYTFDGTTAAPAFAFTSERDTGVYHNTAGNLGLVKAGTERVTVTPTGTGIDTTTPSATIHAAGDGSAANLGGYRIAVVQVDNLPSSAGSFVNLLRLEKAGQGSVVHAEVCDGAHSNVVTSSYVYPTGHFFDVNHTTPQLVLPTKRTTAGAMSATTIDPYQLVTGFDAGAPAPNIMFRLVRTGTGATFTGPIRCTFRVSGQPDDLAVLGVQPGPLPGGSNTAVLSHRGQVAHQTTVTELSSDDRKSYVGIGEPQPKYPLHVVGETQIEGNLNVYTVHAQLTSHAGAPAYSFDGNADTGMYRPSANTLGWSTGGTEWLRLEGAGIAGGSNKLLMRADARFDSNVDANSFSGNGSNVTHLDMNHARLGILNVDRGGTGHGALTDQRLVVGNGSNPVLTPPYLRWDDVSKRLGVSSTSNWTSVAPQHTLHVIGDSFVDGKAYVTGQVHAWPTASAASPTYSFINDTNTGMYRPGADTLGWSTGGTQWLELAGANVNKLRMRANARFDSNVDANSFSGNGSNVTHLDMSHAQLGILNVNRGGTGTSNQLYDRFLVGNGTNAVLSPVYVTWDRANRRMGVSSHSNIDWTSQSPSAALHVIGTVLATDNVIAESDKRKKRDIKPLTDSLARIRALQGVSFKRLLSHDPSYQETRGDLDDRSGNVDSQTSSRDFVGFLAQDVQPIVPEVVTYDAETDAYGIDYGNMTALLVEALKELLHESDSTRAGLQNRCDVLEARLARMEEAVGTLTSLAA